MAYSPIPYQLECGYFPDRRRVKGEWCAKCGSLLSLYKHDWNRILTDETEEAPLWKSKFLSFFFADLTNSAGKTGDKFRT